MRSPRSSWIDRYGDRDGDGFVEYERRLGARPAEPGLEGLAATRSATATGRHSEPPIALAEVQGYVYDAKRRMSPTWRAMRGEAELAERLDAEADAARDALRAAFWVEDQRYYAMALDGDKRQADAIGEQRRPLPVVRASWLPDRARDVVDRLLRPAMFSGWGIRTFGVGSARATTRSATTPGRSGRTTRR